MEAPLRARLHLCRMNDGRGRPRSHSQAAEATLAWWYSEYKGLALLFPSLLRSPPRQLLADSNLPAGSPWEEPLGRGRCALTLLALKVFQPGAKLLHQSLNTRALGEKRNTHQFTAKVQKVRYLYNFVLIQKCCVLHVSKELHHQYLHELKSLQTIGLWIQFGKCIHQVYSLVLTYKM